MSDNEPMRYKRVDNTWATKLRCEREDKKVA